MDVLVPIKLPKVLRVSTPIHNGSNTFRDDSARTGGRRPRWGAVVLSETPPLLHQEPGRQRAPLHDPRPVGDEAPETRSRLENGPWSPAAPQTGLEGAE